jgi:IS30 family transposase
MPNYSQLNHSDLIKIETLLAEGSKAPEIAIRIGKHKTTVYRCIANNTENDEPFNAEVVWQKIRERKSTTNTHPRIVSESLLAKFLVEKIESYWSPEQIAGRWHEDTGEALAHETVYQYIYQKEPQLIKLYLRRRGKKYQHNRKAKYQILDRRMIDDRPKHVELRREFGHWEGDTIVGKDHQGAIATNVERKGGFLFASKIEQANAQNTADVIIEDFQELPESLRLSVTFDNGREFAQHKVIEELAKITVYFAHPYSPWERGSNENTNGLLRQFIPKGTDFATVSEKDLSHYVSLINNRPRKRLNYKTPYEVLQEELAQVALDSRM